MDFYSSMQISNNPIQTSFKSTVRLVEPKAFITSINRIFPYEVVYPWTVKESKLCKAAYTRGVFDCTTVGVTNGQELLLMHICPTEPQNFDFNKIRDYLLKKIDLIRNHCTQGFLLGGKSNNKISNRSFEFFDNFEHIFKQECIPTTKFKGGNYWNDVAYFTEKDTWLIGNERASGLQRVFPDNPLSAAKNIFDEVKLCEFDELSW